MNFFYTPARRVDEVQKRVQVTQALNRETLEMVKEMSPTDQKGFQEVHDHKDALF